MLKTTKRRPMFMLTITKSAEQKRDKKGQKENH